MPIKAYSYIRISSVEQRKGRGEQRQLEAAQAYAEKHGLELDDSLRDLGKSGYHGDHIKTGALGRFLGLVAEGKIEVGSYLIVENLDRLSRQTPIDAQAQFIALLQAGIKIVTLTDGQIYERGGDFTQLIISLTIMSRGHEESARKSYNTKKSRDANRRDMLAGKPRFRSGCSDWITQTPKPGSKDYEFTLNDHAKTVQRIFELADQGVGTLSIARLLNHSNTPVLRTYGTKWWDRTVNRILSNEMAIGTLQVYETIDGKQVPLGEPIKNYYPAAVSEEVFWRVQRNRPKSPRLGRKGTRYANLFQGLSRCSHCGGILVQVNASTGDYKYYRCMKHYRDHDCSGPAKMFPYYNLENAILDHVTDFYLDAQITRNTGVTDRTAIADELNRAQAKLDELDKRRRNVMALSEMADDDETRAEYIVRLREMRVEIDQAKALVAERSNQLHVIDEKQSELSNVTDMVTAERNMWKSGSEEEVFVSRTKVAQALRNFISSVLVDFQMQTAIVYVAGYTRLYQFDRTGTLMTIVNGAGMRFAEVEKVMRMDEASDEDIAKAQSAHAKIQAGSR